MPSEVKLLADSINPAGIRLSTFEVSVHLFIWAEIMTHRVFSRNAQSNRAIPTKKMVEMVRLDPALPIHWGKNQPGMVAEEELPPEQIEILKAEWLKLSQQACDNAERLATLGAHKQFLNRILSPFQYIRAIISATEFENFFRLRIEKSAQPEVRLPAEKMLAALKESTPTQLNWGEWHRPLVREEDFFWAEEKGDLNLLNKLSIARCARVSYLTHQGTREPEKDLELHDRLMKDWHFSPFEHCAMADEQRRSVSNFDSSYLQYRKVIESGNPYNIL